MERENICKFNFNRSSDLICLNFIKETNDSQAKAAKASNHSIHLVISGSGRLVKNSVEHALEAGTLFFVREDDIFSVSSTDALEYCYICFHGRRADEFVQRFEIGTGENEGVFYGYDSLVPFWSECHELAEEGNIDIVCEAVLLYSLAKLKPAKKERNDVISRVVSITQDNFTDPDLSISTVADELGYDQKYLSSLFKKKKGIAYTQYLREQRIKHAIFLMEQGVVSVKNVAILSGFRDALYFSKIFTASEGISPKAYIAELDINK